MYKFVFYFFYRLLPYKESDRIYTSILFCFIVVGLHLVAFSKILKYLNVMGDLPVFSKVYLYNKLYWYIPCAVIFIIMLLYFNKVRVKEIIKHRDVERFFSLKNILFFLLILILPILVLSYLK